jgi:hypothetical protein
LLFVPSRHKQAKAEVATMAEYQWPWHRLCEYQADRVTQLVGVASLIAGARGLMSLNPAGLYHPATQAGDIASAQSEFFAELVGNGVACL